LGRLRQRRSDSQHASERTDPTASIESHCARRLTPTPAEEAVQSCRLESDHLFGCYFVYREQVMIAVPCALDLSLWVAQTGARVIHALSPK
jgi:hypothetical protein